MWGSFSKDGSSAEALDEQRKEKLVLLCSRAPQSLPEPFSPASLGGAQAGVSRHRDAFRVAEVDQLLLVQVRMTLNLEERSGALASVSIL